MLDMTIFPWQITAGDGTVTGYSSPLDAVQRALLMVENDRALNGD